MFVNNRQNIYCFGGFFHLVSGFSGQADKVLTVDFNCHETASLQKCFEIKMHLCGYARQSSPQGATQFTAKRRASLL